MKKKKNMNNSSNKMTGNRETEPKDPEVKLCTLACLLMISIIKHILQIFQ